MSDPASTVITIQVTAMKYPGFFARLDISAADLEEAERRARSHNWDQESFEATSEWPPVQSLLLETADDTRLVDLEPSTPEATAVLRDLVAAIKLAVGTGIHEETDLAILRSPRLGPILARASHILDCKSPTGSPKEPMLFAATYDHKYGSDTRVFRTEVRAEAWRTEIAKEWWDSEFRGDERPSDDEIGAVYFDRMRDGGEEFFSINACELE